MRAAQNWAQSYWARRGYPRTKKSEFGGPCRELSSIYKRRREEAENGVVLHGGLYGPPYELPVGQNVRHGFSGKVISIIYYIYTLGVVFVVKP